jgi:hypothetical protein
MPKVELVEVFDAAEMSVGAEGVGAEIKEEPLTEVSVPTTPSMEEMRLMLQLVTMCSVHCKFRVWGTSRGTTSRWRSGSLPPAAESCRSQFWLALDALSELDLIFSV